VSTDRYSAVGRFALRDFPHTLDEAGHTANISIQLLGGDAERGEDNYFMAAVNLNQIALPAMGMNNTTTAAAEDLEINVCVWVDVNSVVNVTATVLPE
jgi:hypothetical protein